MNGGKQQKTMFTDIIYKIKQNRILNESAIRVHTCTCVQTRSKHKLQFPCMKDSEQSANQDAC